MFDIRVQEQCKSCKRYGKKATCPPYVNSMEYYEDLITHYNCGVIYYKKFKANKGWVTSGNNSSLEINRKIVSDRNKLLKRGLFAIAFGAGSCRLCKTCSFPCRYPDKSLTPLEGIGVNVVATMKKLGVIIKFPVDKEFYRVGAMFWQTEGGR